METYDVIVIGTGGVGSAAAMHLASRGVKVLALDRFPVGHDRGSSHGHTRIIRKAYFEHPNYVPLLERAYELWSELEHLANEKLFHQVGILQVGLPDGPLIKGVRTSAERHRLQVEEIAPSDFSKRFPGFRLDDGYAALFEPVAGYLLVERCVIAHAAQAEKRGAVVRTGEAVQQWCATGNGFRVVTDRSSYEAGRLVITAGAWAGQLLAGLGIRLRVLRKQLFWLGTTGPEYREENAGCCFLYQVDGRSFYGFPQIDDRGVKMAEHTGGEEVADPLTVNRESASADSQPVLDFAKQWLPACRQDILDHATCLYTMSPDEHFIVDKHPDHMNVVFAAGLSGHGFKFACVLGEILASMVLEGTTKQPIDFLSIGRLRN